MAQAQLGFHWGLQLWLGFFDSRPISLPPKESYYLHILVSSYFLTVFGST